MLSPSPALSQSWKPVESQAAAQPGAGAQEASNNCNGVDRQAGASALQRRTVSNSPTAHELLERCLLRPPTAGIGVRSILRLSLLDVINLLSLASQLILHIALPSAF